MTTLTTPEPETTTSGVGQQLVVFSMHGEQYALPITGIREIIRYRRSRSVGAGGNVVQGVINLRGQVVPVCDLSSRSGY
jgi:purine-binding chemotaxis protein CheW